jgi:hypothetical protein
MFGVMLKSSRWTLLAAMIFTINWKYWLWRHPDDIVGLLIYGMTAILFFIASIGNWKSGN